MASDDVDRDVIELISEQLDPAQNPDQEPADAFMMRLGQVQWNQDPDHPEGGYWVASAGWADRELEGLSFADREEARRQGKEYVALLVQGRIKDFFFQ